MPRTYLDKFDGFPLFTNEATVGLQMSNERKDVLLIQFLLKAIMHSGKTYLAGNTSFTPPPGSALNMSGIWDEPSKRYLKRWEELRYEAKAYWGHGKSDPTQFPGTVVSYIQGGKKIRAMQEMCVTMFGAENYMKLKLPNVELPLEVWRELFWDPIRGPRSLP